MSLQPIIIKKIEEDGHGDHHGGGWKVAYADFMTAMMAFFLLLWILAASDEEKLRGLADYFTPSLSQAGGKGQGMLDGMVLGEDGIFSGTDGPQSEVQLPSFGQENPLAVFDSRLRDESTQVIVEYETRPDGTVTDTTSASGEAQTAIEEKAAEAAKAAEMAAAAELREEQLQALEEQIREAVESREDLREFGDNLGFQYTTDGLVVQIVDKEGKSMFDSGSARISERTRDLIRIVGEAIVDLPNTLSISGHTDSVPYSSQNGYTNWELSADRANATRRVLIDTGISASRITRISGLAATEPLNPAAPDAPENRRITVTLSYPEVNQ